MDEWDLLDEVDVIALWPNEHKNNVESKKWQERKEALEALSLLIEKHPRLSTSSMTIYGEIMDNLKKIIARDSNINVVIAALHLLKGLASGLRNRFSCYIPMIWSVVLDKSKDKKATVRDALGGALDAISDACEVDRLTKDICEHLLKPNPQSKQCLCSFLYRYFVRQTTISMDFAKAVLPIVVKLASDSDPAVRDAACNSLGSARRILGKGLDAFLNPIIGEKAKLEKIEEYCVEATKLHSEIMANRPQRAATSESAAGGSIVDEEHVSASGSSEPQGIDPWTLMDPTDVVGQIRKDFDELIASKKWQERKEAVDSLLAIVENAPRVAMSPELQDIITVLTKVLNTDVNINVCSVSAKILAKLATSMRTDFAVVVPKIMAIAFDKLKEKKTILRNELVELCDAASITASLECYTEAVCSGLTRPNPQSRAQTAQFTSRLLSRHDSSTVPVEAVKQIVPDLVKCSSDADGEVRESSFRAMAAVLRCVGEPAARLLFGELSEDKIKMAKIMENLAKIREEFGEKAAPEIVRLHGSSQSKSKPRTTSAAPSRLSDASSAPRKAPTTVRAHVRSTTAPIVRPSSALSDTKKRAPAIAPKRPNVIKAPVSQQPQRSNVARAPLNTCSTQQPAPRRLSGVNKPAVVHSMSNSRIPAKPVFTPNVVRSSTTSQIPSTTAPSRQAAFGPVKIIGSRPVPSTNGNDLCNNPIKTNNALPRSNSGLRPPTAITRIAGTGIPRLSRPSSPAT